MRKTISAVEYVWIDGTSPTKQLRSKTRVLETTGCPKPSEFPVWSADGSSTNQAEGDDSDIELRPVAVFQDPLNPGRFIVLTDVYDKDGQPHPSNTRAPLAAFCEQAADHVPLIGFEQEYTLFHVEEKERPLGWPPYHNGAADPQGPYYCGVGAGKIAGQDISKEHLDACILAGLIIYGANAEVMLGQWEFQIGYRNFAEGKTLLDICDHHWVARYLLERVAEKHGAIVSLHNKPKSGDWNGAGMHTNFSTLRMRGEGGIHHINAAIDKLKVKHREHMAIYGEDNALRLTGKHETCDINTFKAGVSNRGASIRIPRHVAHQEAGYFEDRRPGANADPYEVAAKLIETVCL